MFNQINIFKIRHLNKIYNNNKIKYLNNKGNKIIQIIKLNQISFKIDLNLNFKIIFKVKNHLIEWINIKINLNKCKVNILNSHYIIINQIIFLKINKDQFSKQDKLNHSHSNIQINLYLRINTKDSLIINLINTNNNHKEANTNIIMIFIPNKLIYN